MLLGNMLQTRYQYAANGPIIPAVRAKIMQNFLPQLRNAHILYRKRSAFGEN